MPFLYCPAPLSAFRSRLRTLALTLPVSTDAGATAGGWILYGGVARGIQDFRMISGVCAGFQNRNDPIGLRFLLFFSLSLTPPLTSRYWGAYSLDLVGPGGLATCRAAASWRRGPLQSATTTK